MCFPLSNAWTSYMERHSILLDCPQYMMMEFYMKPSGFETGCGILIIMISDLIELDAVITDVLSGVSKELGSNFHSDFIIYFMQRFLTTNSYYNFSCCRSNCDNYLWRILSYIYHNFGEKDIRYIFVLLVAISFYILFKKSYWIIFDISSEALTINCIC